jgi:hypothetical protein
MPGFLEELASKAGLESDQTHQGVGALLAMLKSRLDPTAFSHLQNSIPNSDEALSKFEFKMQSTGGGLLDSVKSVAGKLLGGNVQDVAAAAQSHFGGAGLSADHLKSFLPALHEMLAGKLPPHVMNQIREHVPGFGQLDEESMAPNRPS